MTKNVNTSTNPPKCDTDTFTSPIFVVVGGSAETIAPKKQVPTVTKAVKDDKEGGSFGDNVFTNPNMAADSRMDQFIDYQLTGPLRVTSTLTAPPTNTSSRISFPNP